MNWSNLKAHKCAKCGADLQVMGMLDDKYYCSNQPLCDFSISAAKYDKITAGEKRKAMDTFNPDENLEALNNI